MCRSFIVPEEAYKAKTASSFGNYFVLELLSSQTEIKYVKNK